MSPVPRGALMTIASFMVIAHLAREGRPLASDNIEAAASASDRSTTSQARVALATFAGGCFWCMETPFEQLEGVIEVVSGYTGGREKNPTYQEVSSASTGHVEAIQVRYDPFSITYEELLAVFWRQVDPTDPGGQFADRGKQYRTAIFYHDEGQRRLAENSKAALQRSGRHHRPIVTEVVRAADFYPAEEYHQDYAKKNPLRYKYYRYRSGRDQYLEGVWGERAEQRADWAEEPSDQELRQRLTPLQYEVTQRNATEPPFDNAYWDSKAEGIYVDVVSGEPLFSSRDKFSSGTGWPSFVRPLEPSNIVEREDRSIFTVRTEVRSRHANSHLGHVFPDGPPPTGLRYCINSAALRFVPKEHLEKEGYTRYLQLFEQ